MSVEEDESVEQIYFNLILKDLCQTIVLETYKEANENNMSDVPEEHQIHISTLRDDDLYNNSADHQLSKFYDQSFVCPNCKCPMTTQRYAKHLEKCIKKNGTR
ncbi:hypothetical protein WA158_001713 [Blastocystis sp. Blastoise]